MVPRKNSFSTISFEPSPEQAKTLGSSGTSKILGNLIFWGQAKNLGKTFLGGRKYFFSKYNILWRQAERLPTFFFPISKYLSSTHFISKNKI